MAEASPYVALSLDGPAPEDRAGDAPRGTIRLAGEVADAYVARLTRAVRAGRLNAFFPPARALRRHLAFLGPAGSRGLYDELHLSRRSGLPSVREILRVKIDRDLAPGFLAEQPADRRQPSPDSRLARRIVYYGELRDAEVMPLNRLTVEVRQLLPDEGRALFRVVLDRFDLSNEQFVRYTILLGQRDGFWRRRHVAVERDLAEATESFRRIVSRFAADEAELCFVLLSAVEGIEVEDVRRCRVGPMLLPGARVGAPLEALLDPEAGPGGAAGVPPWMLCLPEDRAGLEVSEDASSDPLAPLMREAIAEPARELVEARAEELGYRVAKTRKFVCPAALGEPLRALCREVGAPSIVRTVAEGSGGRASCRSTNGSRSEQR